MAARQKNTMFCIRNMSRRTLCRVQFNSHMRKPQASVVHCRQDNMQPGPGDRLARFQVDKDDVDKDVDQRTFSVFSVWKASELRPPFYYLQCAQTPRPLCLEIDNALKRQRSGMLRHRVIQFCQAEFSQIRALYSGVEVIVRINAIRVVTSNQTRVWLDHVHTAHTQTPTHTARPICLPVIMSE